jgi:hypothetical protein
LLKKKFIYENINKAFFLIFFLRSEPLVKNLAAHHCKTGLLLVINALLILLIIKYDINRLGAVPEGLNKNKKKRRI